MLRETFNLDTKRPHLHASMSLNVAKTLAIEKLSKTDLVEGVLRFRAHGAHNQELLPSAPTNVQEENNCRLRNCLPPKRTSPRAGPHVPVKYIKITSVTITILISMHCLCYILYGRHVFPFRFLTSDRFLIMWLLCLRICHHSEDTYWGTWCPR